MGKKDLINSGISQLIGGGKEEKKIKEMDSWKNSPILIGEASTTSIVMDAGLKRAMKIYCAQRGERFNAIISSLLVKYLEDNNYSE